MSSIGLNTNTFRITGKFLELLNDFLVKAKINHEIEGSQKEHLIDFIDKLKDENNTQPQYQLLSNIVERELRADAKDFQGYLQAAINELKQNDTQAFLPKIEFLAGILDTENSEALSKIIGD
jgi:formate dehydrogenase maturation protein FdhE